MRNELGRSFEHTRWTIGVVNCYNNNCNCSTCYIQDLMKTKKCQMKATVLELVKRLGKPFDKKIYF